MYPVTCGNGLIAIFPTECSVLRLTTGFPICYLFFREYTTRKYTGPSIAPHIYQQPSLLVKFSKIFLFTDDTKYHRKICNTDDSAGGLEHPLFLEPWQLASLWCTKMLFTKLPPKIILTQLATTSRHKDLGITVASIPVYSILLMLYSVQHWI